MRAEALQCLRINAPEWFAREDFYEFLAGRRPGQPREDGSPCPPATWHCPGLKANEYSDIFVTYDHGDGSDEEFIPTDIWQEIRRIAGEQGLEYGVVWLTNCAE